MGRRKATKAEEPEAPTRKQSTYEGNGGHVSRKPSTAPRNAEMTRNQSSRHLSRRQSQSGAALRRPSCPPNGNGNSPIPYSGFNNVPPPQQQQQQHYAYAQQGQQQQPYAGPPYPPYPPLTQQQQQYPSGMMMNGGGGEGMTPQQAAHLRSLPQPPLVMTPHGLMPPPVQFAYPVSLIPQRPGGMPPQMQAMYGAQQMPPQHPSLQSRQSFRGPMGNGAMNGGAPHMQPMQPPYMHPQQQQQMQQQQLAQPEMPPPQMPPPQMAPPQASADPLVAQGVSPLLPRSQSILARVSSFKKAATKPHDAEATAAAPAAPAAAEAPAEADAAAGAVTLPRTTSILARRSSFKKAAAPLSEEAQARKAETEMASRLRAREEERLRLQQEMQARAAVEQEMREQRLRELQQRQAVRQNTLREPTTEMAPRVLEEAPRAAAPVPEAAAPTVKLSSPASTKSTSLPPVSQAGPSPPPPRQTAPPAIASPPSVTVSHTSPNSTSASNVKNVKGSQPSPGTISNRSHSPVPDTADLLALLESPVADKPLADAGRSQRPGAMARSAAAPVPVAAAAAPAEAARTTNGATPEAPTQLWHRSPTVALYEVPLRCAKVVNKDGEEQIDDSKFPVRIFGSKLRVQDPARAAPAEFLVDEIATHRRGSTNVESKLLDKVVDIFVAGYSASVLSVDAPGMAKVVSAFDSAAWLAKQRLLMNVAAKVEKMHAIYSHQIGSSSATIEAAFSFALVKKASAQQAAEWGIKTPTMAQRTFEVVDLLQSQPASMPFKMHSNVLHGQRLSGVQYLALRGEAEFTAALATAQANASAFLARLADEVAADPENEVLAKEQASVFEVVTCVLTHRMPGAVTLDEQLGEPAEAVFRRENAGEVISSDDEDDTDAPTVFRAHNGPSGNSDLILSCLTCIGAQESHGLWTAALERNANVVPTALLDTALGGPVFSVVLSSVDPTKAESAATLTTQSAVSLKLHRRALNGSARRLIISAKYGTAMAQHELNGANRPSGAEQRDIKAGIRKLAVSLDSLGKLLESLKVRRFSFASDQV